MEISEQEMNASLRTLLDEGEKIHFPVFAMIKKQTKRMTDQTSEFAYISVTSKARMLLYRFDTYTSYTESYMLDTIMMGDVQHMQSGIYVIELSFLTDLGSKDIYFTVEPKPRGREFPGQERNALKLAEFIEKLI